MLLAFVIQVLMLLSWQLKAWRAASKRERMEYACSGNLSNLVDLQR